MDDVDLYAHLNQKLGLSLAQASYRCGLSPAAFQWLVEEGKLPKPKLVRKRLIWYRPALDDAFADFMADCDSLTAAAEMRNIKEEFLV